MENKLSQAKDVLNERLYTKLGVMLEQRLEDYAPTVFMTQEELEIHEAKKKEDDKEEDSEDEIDYEDEDNDGDIDEDGDKDDSDEYLKNRSEKIKKNTNEEIDSDDDIIEEEFMTELTAIVEEIEAELGEELTEEEIAEIAEELLSEEEICEDCEEETQE
jgi:DNA-directed RNA polymerase subunit beta'